MNGEDLDKALHDCMNTIWKNYREAVTSGNFKPFNKCFNDLYDKYEDLSVHRFIASMGMGLTPAATKRIKGES